MINPVSKMINLRDFMMTHQFLKKDRFLPDEEEVRSFIFELAGQTGILSDKFKGPLINSALKPPELISNVADLNAKEEYSGADIYVYRTSNPNYCKVGFSEDHVKRASPVISGLTSRDRAKRESHYQQYLWHLRLRKRSHAILIEEALMHPCSSSAKIKPVTSDECAAAGIPLSTEIFRTDQIEDIKRRVEIFAEKISLHPDGELEFSKNHIKKYRAEARLMLYARHKNEYASNAIYVSAENRVRVFTPAEQQKALSKGEELMFINWKKWSDHCRGATENETDSPVTKPVLLKRPEHPSHKKRRIKIYSGTSKAKSAVSSKPDVVESVSVTSNNATELVAGKATGRVHPIIRLLSKFLK
jgi:hypothetical protein